MVTYIICLRFLQLYRESGDVGIFRILLIVVFILPLIILFLVQRIAVHPWPLAVPAAALYVLWLIHTRRKDYNFLLAIMPNPKYVFIAEYFLFTLPVTALLLAAALYFHALIFFAFIILISITTPFHARKACRTLKLRIIPSGMFEWQCGIRKNFVVLIIFYIFGLFGFFHVGFSAASLLLLTMVFVTFYSEYEPRNIMTSDGFGAWKFLAKKVAKHTACFAILLLPLLLIALIHDGVRIFTLGYFLAALNLLTFSILLKYYQYRPLAYSGAHQLLTTLACFISVILPVALLFLVFNFFLAFGAIRNLKIYMDDCN